MLLDKSEEVIEFLRQLGRSLGEGTSIHDKQGRFIEVNPRLCEILGYTRDELLKLQIHDVVDTKSLKDEGSFTAHLNDAREDVEIRVIGKDGKKLHFLISVFPMPGKDGAAQGSFNVWNDITSKIEKVRDSQLLKELEDIVAWISVQFINMPWPLIDQGISWLLGDLGTFLKVDRVMVFTLGHSNYLPIEPAHTWLHDASASSASSVSVKPRIKVPPWMMEKIKAKERVVISLTGASSPGMSFLNEMSIKAIACIPITFQDEAVGFLWLDSATGTISWNEGVYNQLQLVGILIANALDRKRTGELLVASEEKYKRLAEAAHDFIIVYNSASRIIYANKAAIEASEYTEAELYKKSIWDFVLPRDIEMSRKELAAVLSDPPGKVVLSEVELVAKNGRRITVEISSSILSKSADEIQILAICRDVSKRKELDKMRHDFVVMASHELKTPMVAILGSADFLMQHFKGEMSDRAFQLVQLVHRGSHRLRNLITELIDVSRIETDKFILQLDTRDLVKIANESIQNLSYLLVECNHEIKTSFPAQLLARVDAQRIDQVFSNLISNAVKNSPHGSQTLVAIELSKDSILVSVRDQGVGLTGEEMAKLFQKFTKIDRHDIDSTINIQGSGLGLYISRQIVESHGGKIWAESAGRGKGSTFYFMLPIK